ncbi:MAG: hypothetical protein ACR2HX_16690 [Pyrinomonadaceae bacterium]
MDQFELERLWASVPGIEGVAFSFRDEVRVMSGEHAGEVGTVVGLVSLEPIPTYTVELSLSGKSLALLQFQLERVV